MGNFKQALEFTLANEGIFSNHKDDRGGPTKMGITIKTLSEFRGRECTLSDILDLSEAEVESIYRQNYWNKFSCDLITFQPLALALFDQAVNRGVSAVVRDLERVLGFVQTGKYSRELAIRLHFANDLKFLSKFLAESMDSYIAIVKSNPSQVVFLGGWAKRIFRILNFAIEHQKN